MRWLSRVEPRRKLAARVRRARRYVEVAWVRRRLVAARPARRPEARPRTVGECVAAGLGRARPCPWVSCAYHLALEVTPSGGLWVNGLSDAPVGPDGVPVVDLAAMPATCALAAAEGGPRTLDEIGAALGLTRERVRQLEAVALARARAFHLPVLREL